MTTMTTETAIWMVDWQSESDLDSIRNSCGVSSSKINQISNVFYLIIFGESLFLNLPTRVMPGRSFEYRQKGPLNIARKVVSRHYCGFCSQNLSKILHRRIFRLKILHRQFHLISTVLVRKNTKDEWKWRNLHRWQKFYTAAGCDGIDKFHLWTKGTHRQAHLTPIVHGCLHSVVA